MLLPGVRDAACEAKSSTSGYELCWSFGGAYLIVMMSLLCS